MNLTPKAQAIEREFLNARAKANYPAFPEFARRYVKHNKDGIGNLSYLSPSRMNLSKLVRELTNKTTAGEAG